MGIDIYGGIYFEQMLDPTNPRLLQQIKLFEDGLICGVQTVVHHPIHIPDSPNNFNSGILAERLAFLPDGFKVFVHLGAESAGADPGERFDEFSVFINRTQNLRDVYKKRIESTNDWPEKERLNQEMTERITHIEPLRWIEWNMEILSWGKMVGEFFTAYGHGTGLDDDTIGATHPGYGYDRNDTEARDRVVKTFKALGPQIALENVPPAVDAYIWEHFRHTKVNWPFRSYWGFGGTPHDMALLLEDLGPDAKCLIDFTHIVAMSNQARWPITAGRVDNGNLGDLDKAVFEFMELPHSSICHYSGYQGEYPHDTHDFMHVMPPSPIREALRTMKAVCLELRWDPNNDDYARRAIDDFRKIIG